MYLLLARCVLLMSVNILEQLTFAVGIVFQLFQQIPYSIFIIPFLTVSIQLFFHFVFGFFMIIMNTILAYEVAYWMYSVFGYNTYLWKSLCTRCRFEPGLWQCNFFYEQPHTGQFTPFFLLLTFCSDERRPTVNKGSKTKSFNTYCIFWM